MKTKILYLLVSLALNSIILNAQNLEWVETIGGSGWDEAVSIKTDQDGNLYIIGYFRGTVDFDPSIATFNLTSVGEKDAFILKIDSNGALVWVKQYGNGFLVESKDLAIDQDGNIFIVGSFLGEVDFDPGSEEFILSSTLLDIDIFVQKFNNEGDFLWARQISGYYPPGEEHLYSCPANAHAIIVNSLGDLIITGYFDGIVDFDPNPSLDHHLTAVNASDIFVLNLSDDGNFNWVKQIGGSQGGVGNSIALDDDDNIYYTGTIGGVFDFDPSEDIFNLSPSNEFMSEYYISKLNNSGNFIWAKSLGSGSGLTIAVDNNGNIISSGWFDTASNPLLFKLDTNGDILWAKDLVGQWTDALTTDSEGNIYTAGFCTGINDFDPGVGVFNLQGEGAYIRKLDASGNFLWAGILDALTSQVNIRAITTDDSDNLYTVGIFDGDVDFDPNNSTNIENTDILSYNFFIQKLYNSSLGLSENEMPNDINIYPNPTIDGLIKIEYNRPINSWSLNVYNALGQLLKSKTLSNNKYAEIDISNESSGIYFLEILTIEYGSVTTKIIKE
ncbi:MAG: hypothetical protein Wins2KO_22610 [Winogradskyella sp.]